MDTRAIKRARLDQIRGQETINQVEHVASAGAKLVMSGCLVPGDLISGDTGAGPIKVGIGNILRIQVGADTYVAFGDDSSIAPMNAAIDISSSPAVKLPVGYHIVVATGEFMRASATPTRVEIVSI